MEKKECKITDSPWVCLDCGKEYMKEQKLPIGDGVITCHQNICCVCSEEKTVTHERHYRWLQKWRENDTDR